MASGILHSRSQILCSALGLLWTAAGCLRCDYQHLYTFLFCHQERPLTGENHLHLSRAGESSFPLEGAHPTAPKSFVYTTFRGSISVGA